MSGPLLVIAGTGIPNRLANLIYGHLRQFGDPTYITGIPHLGLQHIEDAVADLGKQFFWDLHYPRLNIIGHSQGGLIALALAQQWPHFVGRVICLGAPFHGTDMAPAWAPWSGMRCMTTESRWLAGLAVPSTVDVHSFATVTDHAVRPYTSSWLAGATNYVVSEHEPPGVAQWILGTASHTTLMLHPPVLAKIGEILGDTPTTD